MSKLPQIIYSIEKLSEESPVKNNAPMMQILAMKSKNNIMEVFKTMVDNKKVFRISKDSENKLQLEGYVVCMSIEEMANYLLNFCQLDSENRALIIKQMYELNVGLINIGKEKTKKEKQDVESEINGEE